MTQQDILQQVAKGKLKPEDASKLLEAMQPKSNGKLTCKVSQKGAISVYGLQRMPVTLFAGQWERLLEGAPEDHFVLAYIREWEGKPFTGKDSKGNTYTATIARKS